MNANEKVQGYAVTWDVILVSYVSLKDFKKIV